MTGMNERNCARQIIVFLQKHPHISLSPAFQGHTVYSLPLSSFHSFDTFDWGLSGCAKIITCLIRLWVLFTLRIWSSHYSACNQIWGLLVLWGFSCSRWARQSFSLPQHLWSAGRRSYPSSPLSSTRQLPLSPANPNCAYTQTQKQSCGQMKMQTNATQMPMIEHVNQGRQ